MGFDLFGWLFGKGDDVEYTDDKGDKHHAKVDRFKPEGFVELNEDGKSKTVFGGKLSKSDGKKS